MSKIEPWMKARKNMLFAAAAAAVLTAGMSLAFFTDSEIAVNTVKAGKVQIGTNEELSGLTKSDISVTGDGTSPCYVRMRVDVPVLKYGGGEVLSPTVNYNDEDFDSSTSVDGKEWNEYGNGRVIGTGESEESSKEVEMAEWLKKEDGYWYLSVALKPEDTAVLCNEVEYKDILADGELKLPAGISKDQLSIVVYAEAVQADNIDVSGAAGADAAYAAFQQLKAE